MTPTEEFQPDEESAVRKPFSRRSFMHGGTLTVAALGLAGSMPGLAGLAAAASSDAPAVDGGLSEAEAEAAAAGEPLVAHVKDLLTGEISLFRGEQQIIVRDPSLARALHAATRP